MSIAYRIDKEIGLTLVRWDGTVTATEFLAQIRSLTSDPNWPPPRRRHIADTRNARLDSSMDQATLKQAAHIYAEHRDKIANMRIAIIATDTFKQAVAYEQVLLQYGATTVVFNNIDPAVTWLGLAPDTVQSAFQQLPPLAPPPNRAR
ncbi:MAG TPA: hypothetical protein VMP11_14690 [Verrucomicrobiae bacterium]|nr:hypothetical protein [Verrucomicrobiae bacterium]